MGRGVVNKPLKDLAEFYKDIESTFIWDHLLVVSLSSFVLSLCDMQAYINNTYIAGCSICTASFRIYNTCGLHRYYSAL